MDQEALYTKFTEQNYDNESMFDFIRAEYLNLVDKRKAFLKQEKERIKAEKFR